MASFTYAALGEPISVKHPQGAARGFLVIRSESGELLGTGELTQISRGDNVTSRLVYNFLDGSVDDDTTTYSQRGTFRLIRDHHVQKGPFFDKATDVTVEAGTSTVTTKTLDKDGKPKVQIEHVDLPDDVANGFVSTLLLNVPRDAATFKVGMVAPSGSKGRLVKLAIAATAGEQSFRIAGRLRKATVFRIHVDLGGIAALVAPVVGKEPKDLMIWVLEGEAPALIREVGQMYVGGPVVSIELAGTRFDKSE